MPTPYVALLRGINVGGHNRLPMADLRALLETLGHERVATYLQSGNAVFTSTEDEPTVARGIEEALQASLGLDVPVVLRNGRELEAVARLHPFDDGQADHAKLHVLFLASAPGAEAAARLDPGTFTPDVFAIDGRAMYVSYPNGSGRSKLTIDRVERALGITVTGRNWRTVSKLDEMLRGLR